MASSSAMIIRVPESAGEIYERIEYPAGELQVRIKPAMLPTLFGIQKIAVVCREAHKHLMELALLSDALRHLLGQDVEMRLILPYMPYGRADRRFVEGDCHGLATFGRMLNWGIGGYDEVVTLDAHSYRMPKSVGQLLNVNPLALIQKALSDIYDRGHGLPAVLLPDGGARRYELSRLINVRQCTKRRDALTGQLSGFEVPDFEERSALIVDDICDGGGTFVGLAQAINKNVWGPPKAPKHLYLYVTHGIFSKGLQQLCQYFEKIYTTNSFYEADADYRFEKGIFFPGKRLEVMDCEPLLLEAK